MKKAAVVGKLFFSAVFLAMLAYVPGAWADACFSVSWPGHENWNDPTNWNCGGSAGIPDSGDTVEITNGSPILMNTSPTVQTIWIRSGATLTADNNSRVLTLTASPSFTVDSTGSFVPGNSTVIINRNGNTTLTSGTITFYDLQLSPVISGNRTYTFGTGAISINSNFNINPTRSSGGVRALTVNMASSVTVAGTTTIQASGGRATAELDTVASANALTTGRLIIASNGTLTANGSTIALNGSTGPLFTLSGTFNEDTSTVLMNSPASVTLTSGNMPTFYDLTVNMAGQTGTLGTDAYVLNQLTLTNGTFAVGSNTLSIDGPAIAGTLNNLSTTTLSTLSFGGSSSGVILPASVTQVNRLIVNNTNGITLNGSPTLSGSLILFNGAVTTGSNTVNATTTNCPGNVSRTNGYVNGNLRLKFGVGSNTCTFDVGSGSVYTPIAVTTPTLSAGGLLTGSTVGAEHPQIADSAIDSTKDVNRYWTLSGDTINASSYSVIFNFVAGDVDSGAATGSFVIGKYDSGTWSAPTSITASATSTGSINIPGPLTNSAFAAGEATFVCSVPAGMPSTVTCVCDNFGRASLNPSTIYGGNWAVSSSSGSFGVPRIATTGFLRMTDNSGNVATAATMPGTFPAAGNMISVDFKHYAYNGSGADGIALTLSDSTKAPTPGAYGGSLGFAPKDAANCASPPCNGFNGGWIGIGIDEFGNYSNPTEGRTGGPGSRPDAVAVRGSGSGLTGFPYLGGTGSLSPGVDNPGSSTASFGHAYRIIVDARCYERDTSNSDIVCNNPSSSKKAQVTVYRDTTGVGSFTASNKIVDFDAYAANASQADVPANWKLSFTGSTGGLANIHEIQGIKICAQTITPPAGYRIQVDNLTPSTCGTPGGSPSSPIVTVSALDTNGNIVTTYDKTVNLSATLSGGGTSSATWRKVGATSNLTGNQYTFVAADNGVAQFYLTDASPQSVFITVSENGGTISSSLGTAVVYSGGSFNITNIDTLGSQVGGGVVAGRNHLMQITRTNGCSVDTTYNGTKNLDGWYTPATNDHPTGALAPQICAPNAGGTCLSSIGTCQTLSIAPPTVDSNSNFMPALTFSSGVAKFCIATTDVGKYSVSLRDDSATAVTGSSGTLTARPFAVAVRDVKGVNNNPANSGSGGAVIGNAGANFQATVAGYLWDSGADIDGDGVPDSSASLTQIANTGLAPHYADTVAVAAVSPSYPPPSGSAPVLGVLAGSPVVVSNGSTTSLSLSYSEVGTFTLSATPSTSYLNSGVNLSNRMTIFANPSDSITRTALVGRFKPDHFTISGGSVTNRSDSVCNPVSAFTYMEEPMRVGFTLEARNASGDLTKNYSGDWAKFTTTNWIPSGTTDSVGLWMVADNYPVSPGTCRAVFDTAAGTNTTFICDAGVTTPAALARAAGARVEMSAQAALPSWSNGLGTFSADVTLHRADTTDGPYATLDVGVAPIDSEGTSLKSTLLNLDTDSTTGSDRFKIATTEARFGRLRMFNAIGSDRLPMPLQLQTEYWNGTGFQVNGLDSCTSLVQNNFAMSYGGSGGINASTMPLSNLIVGAFNAGTGTGFRLDRPTGGTSVSGSAILCVDLAPDTSPGPVCQATTPLAMPWLQGRWSTPANYDDDPTARATFGIFRGGPIIYMREVY